MGQSSDAPSQSKVDGTVAQCAVAISIRDVAIDVVGTSLRDVVVPLQGAPSGREAERGVCCRGGILADVPPVKWPMGQSSDAPSQSKVDGTVAQCAVAISIRDVAIDVVGTSLRDVVVPLQGAPSGREAERGVCCRGGILASFSP